MSSNSVMTPAICFKCFSIGMSIFIPFCYQPP
jgi:hypothetical protein